jgi:peptidoglycan/LPS O-acetylase OafA/YrhL
LFNSKYFILPIGTAFYLYHKGRLKRGVYELFAISTVLFLIAKPSTEYIIALVIWIAFFALQDRINKVPKLLNGVAEISYPLYLIHTIAYFTISALANNGVNLFYSYTLSLALIFSLSYFTTRHIESRGILLGKKLMGT